MKREDFHKTFYEAWAKHREGKPLSDLESQIVALIDFHPEFHDFFDNQRNISEEENPFLHLSFHLALLEQLSTDRPAGITALYQKVAQHLKNGHQADHLFMGVLANTLESMQHQGHAPDDATYLSSIKTHLKQVLTGADFLSD